MTIPTPTWQQTAASPMPSRIIFVRSKEKNETDASIRLTFVPLHNEFVRRGLDSQLIQTPESLPQLDDCDCIVFQYNDRRAVEAVGAARRAGAKTTMICVGGDIYSFQRYVEIHEFVDFYVVPTDAHRNILSSQLYKPIFTLPEAIDRLMLASKQTARTLTSFPEKRSRRICWFGYAESFNKGMASLVPVIRHALSTKKIDSFKLILNTQEFDNTFGFDTEEFDHTTFSARAREFDYTILSHFALDLAINSHIKSPNKAVSAFFAGLIPLATDTPNYGSLFRMLGVERFLFSSPQELSALFDAALNPREDSRLLQELGVLERLEAGFSDTAIADQFLGLYQRFITKKGGLLDLPIAMMPPEPTKPVYLSEHLKDLLPSALRSLSGRLGRMTRGRRRDE